MNLSLFNGGWEFDNGDLSLLDFITIGLNLGYKDGKLDLNLMASAWSPSITINLFGTNITFSFEIGSVGLNFNLDKWKPQKIGAAYGIGFNVSW